MHIDHKFCFFFFLKLYEEYEHSGTTRSVTLLISRPVRLLGKGVAIRLNS